VGSHWPPQRTRVNSNRRGGKYAKHRFGPVAAGGIVCVVLTLLSSAAPPAAGLLSTPGGQTWVKLAPTVHPVAAVYPQLAYDPQGGYILEYGGWTYLGYCQNETWEFSGGNWSRIHPSESPPSIGTMAYDNATKHVIYYADVLPIGSGQGNCFSQTRTNQTWSFANGTWVRLHPASSPPVNFYGEYSAFNYASGRLVMYGILQNLTSYAVERVETWAFSNGTWTLYSSSNLGAPYLAGMAYDPNYHAIVAIGQLGVTNQRLATFWFKHGAWTVLNSSGLPWKLVRVSKSAQSMVYDPAIGALVLSESACNKNCVYNQGPGGLEHTFEFKNGSWTRLAPTLSPFARWCFGMAYDAEESRIIQFGGAPVVGSAPYLYAQTWEF
jgi:hypothetical protein